MNVKLSPYINFNGNCRDAMTFYKECFGGELTMQTIAETPFAAQCPSGMQDHIMHSMLKNNDFLLMASDMQRPEGHKPGNDSALSLSFQSEQDIRTSYEKLSEGGEVIDELKVAFWGDLFGVVKDKFGKVWMMDFPKKNNS